MVEQSYIEKHNLNISHQKKQISETCTLISILGGGNLFARW